MTPDPDDASVVGDDQSIELRQIIGLGLLDGKSGNAFNVPDRLGVDDATFTGATKAQQAQIRGGIRRRFGRLERERRARLSEVTFSRSTEQDMPTLKAQIVYEDLETGARQEMERSLG